jgi:hypothetical protein
VSCVPREYANASVTYVWFPLNLRCAVYEDNTGRILKCGHEVCAGKAERVVYVQEFPLFTRRATDCLEDMGNSAIVHNGIFGYGDEGQNIAAEKAFEDAQARGFRPCAFLSFLTPVC